MRYGEILSSHIRGGILTARMEFIQMGECPPAGGAYAEYRGSLLKGTYALRPDGGAHSASAGWLRL